MITKSDLQLICNYSESNTSGLPVGQVCYMEFIEDDAEYKRQLIRDRREKVIDAIVDDKVDEFEKFSEEKFSEDLEVRESYIPSISPRLMTKNVTSNKFISYDKLWQEVMLKLESLTSTTSKHQPVGISGIDADALCRRIITRCVLLSNLIASSGRTGPATTIIVGSNVVPHLMSFPYYTNQAFTSSSLNNSKSMISIGTISGMDVVTDPIISPNKIIIIRTENRPDTGLTVVKSINHDEYFLSELGKWENKIQWFDVI